MLGRMFRSRVPRLAAAACCGLAILAISAGPVSATHHTGVRIASSRAGGVITISGQIGSLRVDVSSASAITRALGAPRVEASQAPLGPGYPGSTVFGYKCSGPRINQCDTTYFVSQTTHRLESFSTTSPSYRLASGARVGMSGSEAARLTHEHDLGGCTQGISLSTPTLSVYLGTEGGQTHPEGNELRISGGRVTYIAVEDLRHGVGVLFC
jgi:hypothetical protein